LSTEKDMRRRVIRVLRPLDAQSVENGCVPGMPDVNYVHGWIELKSAERFPVGLGVLHGAVDKDHFTPQQRVWLRRRRRAGGEAWLLLKVAHDWFLLDGLWAAEHLGIDATRNDILQNAHRAWVGGLVEKELLACLKKS